MDKFDVQVFTASCDDEATNKKYATALKLDYPILSDPKKDVAKSYGVVHGKRQVPERWTFYIGKDGKLLHVDRKVSARTHAADIAKKLTELGVAKKKKK